MPKTHSSANHAYSLVDRIIRCLITSGLALLQEGKTIGECTEYLKDKVLMKLRGRRSKLGIQGVVKNF